MDIKRENSLRQLATRDKSRDLLECLIIETPP